MCEFCENIAYTDEDIATSRNDGYDFIYKVDNEYRIYISTAEYCHPGILGNIEFCPMCGRKLSEVNNNDFQ